MTTSTEPSGRGRQYPLSACIGSPDAAFHVFCVYEITGCTPPTTNPAIQRKTSKIWATKREDFSRGKRGSYLGGVVREQELLAVAEGGDCREAALSFPAPLAQKERQRSHRRVRRRRLRGRRACAGGCHSSFLGGSGWAVDSPLVSRSAPSLSSRGCEGLVF